MPIGYRQKCKFCGIELSLKEAKVASEKVKTANLPFLELSKSCFLNSANDAYFQIIKKGDFVFGTANSFFFAR